MKKKTPQTKHKKSKENITVDRDVLRDIPEDEIPLVAQAIASLILSKRTDKGKPSNSEDNFQSGNE